MKQKVKETERMKQTKWWFFGKKNKTNLSAPVWRGRERGKEETQEGAKEGDRGRRREWFKRGKITNMVTFLMKREHYLQMYAINLKSEMKQAIFSEI